MEQFLASHSESIYVIIVMQVAHIALAMHPASRCLVKDFSICFRLFQVRGKLYELLVNCIPPEIILKVRTASFIYFDFDFVFYFELNTYNFLVGSEAGL